MILFCHSFVCGFTGVLMWYFLMVLWMHFVIPLMRRGNCNYSDVVCAEGFFVIFLRSSFISFWLLVFLFLWTILGIVSFFMWVSSSSPLSSSVMIFARSYRLPTAKRHLDSPVLGGCTTLFCFCLVVVSVGLSVSFSSSLLCLLSLSYVYLCIFCIFILFHVHNYCSSCLIWQ